MNTFYSSAANCCFTLDRAGRGGKASPSTQPTQPLIFWGYEASPFVKVRGVKDQIKGKGPKAGI